MGSILSSNIANMTEDETQKYKKFLQDELSKINETKIESASKKIKIE
jgi:hypothetical protein